MRLLASEFLLALVILVAPVAPRTLAQTPAPATASNPAAQYAEESYVVQRLDTVFTFAADGTGTQERTVVIRVQSEAALRSLGVLSISYAGNSEQVEFLYVRVRRPDGTVVDSDTTGSLDMPAPVTREAPFYSDLKDKQLPIRSLRVGDTLEWKVRITRTKAEAPGQFWGQETFSEATAVVLSENFELRVPSGIYVNVWSHATKPTETTEANQHIYRWTTSQLKPTVGKQAEAAAEAKKKAVWTADQELDAEEGKLPSIAWTTFKSWEDVGAWYHGLEADRTTPSPEIKAKAAELIAGKSTDEEKVRALYAYVATQIRYIGVDFGIGRYQPHTAAEILTNQYGDCKDKHTLLATMLSAAGIPSDAVLIGAGVRFNSAVPSPASFNHLITHLTVAGKPVWLDATAEIAPYRMLSAAIRDEQALIVPPTGPAHLDRTPADPPFPVSQTWEATGKLDDTGTSHSRLTLAFRGDDELALRAAFRQVAPAQYDPVVQQFIRNMGYQGTTSNAEVSRPEDTAEPFKISFDYMREKPGDWSDLKTLPQLAPVELPRYDDKDPLVRSLNLGAPRVEISHSAMKLPDAWGAVFPEAIHLKSTYATYDQTYRFDNGTIYSERRIEILKPKVPQSDLKIYKKWADDASIGEEFYIQLVKHDASKMPAKMFLRYKADPNSVQDYSYILGLTPGEAGGDAKADELIRSAFDSVKGQDLDVARKSLDQARTLSPEQLGLWSVYGLLALKTHAWTDVIDDFQKELKLHPEQTTLYTILVPLEKNYGSHKQMIETLRSWIAKGNPTYSTYSQLIEVLTDDGDPKAAVAVAHEALASLSQDQQKDFSLQLAIGTAQFKAGEQTTAFETLKSLIHESQNPLLLNEVAYNMAEASQSVPVLLPLSETAAHAALDNLTARSDNFTLSSNISTPRALSRLTQATWDTLGWIYFRQGKLTEAQEYIEASWHGSHGAAEAVHLGEIALARGDKQAAMDDFQVALIKEITYDASGARNPPTAAEKETQQHIDELQKAGIKFNSSQLSPEQRAQDLFKIPLGPSKGITGVVKYRLLLKNGKLVKAQLDSTKDVPNVESLFEKADFSSLFPPNSPTSIVRLGLINCHADVCDLTLEP